MTYRPKFRKQIGDPTTTYDAYICTMECGAMALDFETVGAIQIWGGQLLDHANLSHENIINGTNLYDVERAWKNGYDKNFIIKNGETFNDMMGDLKAGHGIILQGDYDVFTGSETCQDSFNGGHAVYLNNEFFEGDTKIAAADPLCGSFKRIRITSLRKYAEKLGAQVYGPSSPQKIFYGTTTRTDKVSAPCILKLYSTEEKYSYNVKAGTVHYDVPNGNVTGTITDETIRFDVNVQDARTATWVLIDGRSSNSTLMRWVKVDSLINQDSSTAVLEEQVENLLAEVDVLNESNAALQSRIDGIKQKTSDFNTDIQDD